jgi:hypothetical protein
MVLRRGYAAPQHHQCSMCLLGTEFLVVLAKMASFAGHFC